jgi:hypothetical protein
VTKTGQHEYRATLMLKGVKPSVATESRTFLLSIANSGSLHRIAAKLLVGAEYGPDTNQ